MKTLLFAGVFYLTALACVLGSRAAGLGRQAGRPPHPYRSEKPLARPTLFAEGLISTGDYESHPAFTPDGATLYFLKSAPSFNFWCIVVSRFRSGRWGEPEVAPFSGRHSDADPFITPDGSRLYFISDRPAPGKASDDLDIWVVEREGEGWGEPKNLGPPVNSERNEWFPTLTRDGTLYFGSERPGGLGGTDLYRARLVDGKYAEPENLGPSVNTKFGEFEPLVSQDESLLLFAATGRPEGRGGFDLYVSRRREGKWAQARSLGDVVNTAATEFAPKVSPDGNYLFFTSTRGFADAPRPEKLTYQGLINRIRSAGNGLGDIYQVGFSALGLGDEP
jgi:Tol biopolymer transport system component